MKTILSILVFCSIMISCSDSKKTEQVTNLKKSQIDSTRYTIIFDYFGFGNEIEYSDLELDEINKVLLLVENCIGKHNQKVEDYWKINIDKYKFQLVPIINEQGEKEVWVNSFCSENSKLFPNELEWKNSAIVVFDGGKCYFNLKVNLNTFKAFELSINGEA